MSNFLDKTGLSYFWNKIKTYVSQNFIKSPTTGSAGQILYKTADGVKWDDNIVPKSVQVTLLASGWSSYEDYYSQTVNVSFVSSDTPIVIVDCALTGATREENDQILEAWGEVSSYDVDQGDGSLTFYISEVPDTNIPINVGVM